MPGWTGHLLCSSADVGVSLLASALSCNTAKSILDPTPRRPGYPVSRFPEADLTKQFRPHGKPEGRPSPRHWIASSHPGRWLTGPVDTPSPPRKEHSMPTWSKPMPGNGHEDVA